MIKILPMNRGLFTIGQSLDSLTYHMHVLCPAHMEHNMLDMTSISKTS